MQFPDSQGTYHQEFYYLEYYDWYKKLIKLRNTIRHRLGLGVYWWHVSYDMFAEERKCYDMHFMKHVEEDHGGAPDDKQEQKYYAKCLKRYSPEYDWVKRVLASEPVHVRDEPVYHASLWYELVYRERWMTATPLRQWTTMYHGVSEIDACELLLDEYKRIQKTKSGQDEEKSEYSEYLEGCKCRKNEVPAE